MAQLSDFQNRWHHGALPLHPLCANAQPGTFGHECGARPRWVGTRPSVNTSDSLFHACFCDDCKSAGFEARGISIWTPLDREVV